METTDRITHYDQLTISQFIASSPEDAPEVKAIDEQMKPLEEERRQLGPVVDVEAALVEAKAELKEAKVQCKLGEAAETDVTAVENYVQQLQEDLQELETIQEALSRLEPRREEMVQAARRAMYKRAAVLYRKQIDKAADRLHQGLEELEKATALIDAAAGGLSGRRLMVMQRVKEIKIELHRNPFSAEEALEDLLREIPAWDAMRQATES